MQLYLNKQKPDEIKTVDRSNEVENLPKRPSLPSACLRKNQMSIYETTETINLSTPQLQRLVLLEQLKTTRTTRQHYLNKMKQRMPNIEIQNTLGNLFDDNEAIEAYRQDQSIENNKTFTVL